MPSYLLNSSAYSLRLKHQIIQRTVNNFARDWMTWDTELLKRSVGV